MATILRGRELAASVSSPYNCGNCFEPILENGWLCDNCWKERESQHNRYGLTRLEGVDYACECFASGTDGKGNKFVMSDSWKHEKNCSLFKRKVWSECICECPKGSTINDDGSITVHNENHDLDCPIRKKLGKDSVIINAFFGGYA